MPTMNNTAQKNDFTPSPGSSGAFSYPELKERLARSPFRSRFKLGEKELRYAAENKAEVISAHARKIITERLAPALPVNDGKQTPMHGHAIFIAQHATACCCRGCLARWHGIPAGRELSEKEITCIADILVRWIKDQLAEAAPEAYTPPLF